MRLTFLGTGTSFGIPVIGCDCAACSSTDPRDRRTRHGAILELEGGNVLVDSPPELRLQLLDAGISRVDAVWYTHPHADHVHGIDDLRIFTVRGRGTLPAWVGVEHHDRMARHFDYVFDKDHPIEPGLSRPRLELRDLRHGVAVEICGAPFLPVAVPHGPSTVYGFRVGALGYVTDGKSLPADALDILRGVEVMVLNALWFGKPHPAHFNVEEAVDAARAVGAGTTYLTHLTHRVTHRELLERLPPGVEPAYDGLAIEVD